MRAWRVWSRGAGRGGARARGTLEHRSREQNPANGRQMAAQRSGAALWQRAKGKGQRATVKRRILVVDDSPAITEMLAQLLSGSGFDVVTAGTYEQGKQLAGSANPDLLLVDVRLGDYNGLQLALRERIDHPHRPIIVMTGYADPVLEAEARRQGATFVEKPIEPTRLVALIRDLLDGDGA